MDMAFSDSRPLEPVEHQDRMEGMEGMEELGAKWVNSFIQSFLSIYFAG